jgi:8-oxo-dGTP diphosphatase
MEMPYRISTLLYCFNASDEVLLMRRSQEPNLGLWSPCGGKVNISRGESPHACAVREAAEETAMILTAQDLHLTGIVSERAYEGQAHWLMFLFEVKRKLAGVPAPIREGSFGCFQRSELDHLGLPRTDREMIWPLFWEHRGGFFAAHCHCRSDGGHDWVLEESRPVKRAVDG